MIDNKILENSEMSEEELEKVAGGTASEIADDSCFLNSLNGSCDRYGKYRILFEDHDDEIEKAWRTVGIEAKVSSAGGDNKYYLNGQQISQEQARQHALKVTNHYVAESESR